YRLAETLRHAGRFEEAFEALQRAKGRRLLDALAMNANGGNADDHPASLAETQQLLARMETTGPTVLVDLAIELEGLAAYIVDATGLRVIPVTGQTLELDGINLGDLRDRSAQLVEVCLENGLLRELANAVMRDRALAPEGRPRILIVPSPR